MVEATVSTGPGRSKDQRTFGPRSQVGQPGSSKEGAVLLEATPELVSQDRERVSLGPSGFQGTRLRTPADPSLGAVGAGSNAGPHFRLGPAAWARAASTLTATMSHTPEPTLGNFLIPSPDTKLHFLRLACQVAMVRAGPELR